jgi:diacylglycerol kinase (ATP)
MKRRAILPTWIRLWVPRPSALLGADPRPLFYRMSAVTAPAPSPPPERPDRLPFGPPYLIGDPAAARADLTLLRRALARAGVVAEAAVARPVGQAGAIAARALEDGHRLLVAVGSDRLAHALLRVLVGPDGPRWPDAVLGLAGLGRQDLAATFGLPDEPYQLARHLLGPNRFLADVGRARWRGPDGTERVGVFANTAELGYPAEVSARVPAAASAGRVGRLAAALGALRVSRSTPARLELDHAAVELRLAGLVVANGQFSMGRMKVAPRALPDDGRMSVLAFQGEPLGIYARSKNLYYGDHVPHPSIREYQSRRVAVDTAEPLALTLDGWRAAGGPPLTVDVLEQILQIKV